MEFRVGRRIPDDTSVPAACARYLRERGGDLALYCRIAQRKRQGR
jgi:hypothetical protein